jgi:hypothetical protein
MLGDLAPLYREMALRAQSAADSEPAPQRGQLRVGANISHGHILDSLGVVKDCCRMRMITSMSFEELNR